MSKSHEETCPHPNRFSPVRSSFVSDCLWQWQFLSLPLTSWSPPALARFPVALRHWFSPAQQEADRQRHWEMATGMPELTERDGGGDESTSEHMCRTECFCVRIPFAPWAMESRNQTVLFHMGTRAGWQALTRSALPAHAAALKSFTRSPQAQAGFNVHPSHPAGSGQQPKARGQRADRGPPTPSPAEHQEIPRHFWWRLNMKSAIKKQIHRNAGETGAPNLFPWQDQAGRNTCAHVS